MGFTQTIADDTDLFPVYEGKVTGTNPIMPKFRNAWVQKNWALWREALWAFGNTDTDPWSDDTADLLASGVLSAGKSGTANYPVYASKAAALEDCRYAFIERNWAHAHDFIARLGNTNCAVWSDDTVRDDP